jgi:hypothetical protein
MIILNKSMKICCRFGKKVIYFWYSKIKALKEIKIYLIVNSSSNLTNWIVNVGYDKMPTSKWEIKSR